MADAALAREQPRNAPSTWTIKVSVSAVDAVIALGGSILFAAAGVVLGFYLMPPFDIG